MEIKSIKLEYTHRFGLDSHSMDNIRHVKTLPYISVVQAVTGNYDISLGGGEVYNTGEKGFFIAPSDIKQTIVHHADTDSRRMVCRWIFLRIKLNDLYYFDKVYDLPVILPDAYWDELNSVFDCIFASGNVFDDYVYYYKIVKILSSVAKEKPVRNTLHGINNVLEYIKTNYMNKITVSHLAAEANMSDSHFYSVFKKETGVSPIAYLNNYRLSVAAELLLRSDSSVSEISDSVGIGDSVYLNKLFRKTYQMSPSKYRAVYKS